ncbi:MAG: RelA/SpoT family protein [Bacteroidetes bacterium]|nr:RelA/SpoT family protein [Bacteroidota bacterium]
MYQVDADKEKTEILRRYRDLLNSWTAKKEPADKQLVRKAFNLAVNAHKDMRRKSGEPYIFHPLEVARIVAGEIGLSTTSIVCALLHDVVEDTDYTLEDIRGMFGDKIARIIDGLTKISGIMDLTNTTLQAENFKKMLLTLADDVRVILIKLADRLHNMRTLEALPVEKRLKISSETLYLYAPLAHRLGLYSIKSELEDLALKHTDPEIYRTISQKLKDTQEDRKRFINQFIYPIKKVIANQGIESKIIAREKSIYSIWEKMRVKGIPFEEVYDIFAIRIIISVPQEREKVECWKVYSAITDYYRPNQKRLRDWISTPKANGYEALHTTVMSQTGRWVEIQIRSERMDEVAEKGYAAHWKYKTNGTSEGVVDAWLNRIRDMLTQEDTNALDFVNDFKLNLYTDEIITFTPKGEMKNLPVGSTVIDFAYNVHSEVGNQAIGAKVNHNLVPLNHILKSGDQVEIITSKKQEPKEEWLAFALTARARYRIKAALKEEKKKYAAEGKKILVDLFNQNHINVTSEVLEEFRKFMKFESKLDLYYQTHKGRIRLKDIKDFGQTEEKGSWFRYISRPFTKSRASDHDTLNHKIVEQLRKKPESMILGDDVKELKYDVAKCCNPIPGDDVIGFLMPRGNIEIHRTNCPMAIENMSRYGSRIVKTKWKTDEAIGFLTGIAIKGIDRNGLVRQISEIISDKHNIGIRSFLMDTSEGMTNGIVMLYVQDTRTLNQLIDNLKEIKEIQSVKRIDRTDLAVHGR